MNRTWQDLGYLLIIQCYNLEHIYQVLSFSFNSFCYNKNHDKVNPLALLFSVWNSAAIDCHFFFCRQMSTVPYAFDLRSLNEESIYCALWSFMGACTNHVGNRGGWGVAQMTTKLYNSYLGHIYLQFPL